MWEGLKQYAISGHNTGRCPYGYAEDRTPHPNPMKQSMGATRARLVPDPERGPWVTQMFEWRVYEQLDCNGIARRLTELGAPSRDGRAVGLRQRLQHPAQPEVHRQGRARPHPQRRRPAAPGRTESPPGAARALDLGRRRQRAPCPGVMELWEAAQEVGRKRGSVRDHTAPPAGRHLYPLRSRITCHQCQRRMCGLTAPAPPHLLRVPAQPQQPPPRRRHPGHVRAAFRDHVIYHAVDGILGGLLATTRPPWSPHAFPPPRPTPTPRAAEKPPQLRRRIDQAEARMKGLIAQLEHLGDGKTPPPARSATASTSSSPNRTTSTPPPKPNSTPSPPASPPPNDPSPLDELPYAPGLLASAPAELRARIYAAFQVHALYRAQQHQATITATITDQTPGLIPP